MKCTSLRKYGPCKNCLGCRVNHAASWAVRGAHERMMHDDACSITLTYSEDHVPWSGLQKKHLQDFFKRLRRQLEYYDMPGQGFKYMACGEYGEQLERPHFHAVFFGLDFPDKYFWRTTELGHKVYRSDFLESQWTFGNCEIGNADDDMINYVASYILKKVNGEKMVDHYSTYLHCDVLLNRFDWIRPQEFFLSSRRPAIGLTFLQDYWDDIFSYDELVLHGRFKNIPTYYLNKLRDKSEGIYQMIKRERAFSRLEREVLYPDREALTKALSDVSINQKARMSLYS